ncbi:iron ABC transporter substrate-binding protein [Gleimia sp. 6138-11-ORH1]|uniref:iron ABC transporter substrate-binding protein n=1 Tax=Gleimia sp. 6138-11-ORH1 TaxID=2973937 RepID=UPI002166D067|nr:iron ABC transporter substrate-binding protein [Gleimia sp. 6138-11-ORH1]MCS4484581.1 iron ABC transporter substrate-binding protein [Gleimia sp. 6138-11-ORH1]
MQIRKLATFATAGILTLSLAACGGATQAPKAEDKPTESKSESHTHTKPEINKDETLVVYSGRNEKLVGPLLEEFTKDTGIKVDVRYAGTPELAAQLVEEADKTPAHVFLSQDAGALGLVGGKGMFTDFPHELAEKVDAKYSAKDHSWVGLTGRARVVAYDSQTLKADEVPADIWELTDPKWKGQIGIAPGNASFQSFVTALRVAEGEEKAEEWLNKIIANEPQKFAKNGEILEAVNTGGVKLGLINHYYWARSEQDPKTLRAQLKFGKPGTVGALINVTGVGILKNAENNGNAYAFAEYLLSEKAQKYFMENTAEYPLVAGIGEPANVPPLAELGGADIDLAKLDSLEETIKLLTKVGLL